MQAEGSDRQVNEVKGLASYKLQAASAKQQAASSKQP
jgi:hypothetical protein